MSVTPAVMRRIMRELGELQTNPPEGIRVVNNEDNMLDVTGIIKGPDGTPYAGGYFRVKFKFTEEFPAAPPKCWFATKIFHPNVGPTGEICVNTLKKDWKSTYGIGHILLTVKCLLIYPNPESALDEEAGRLLLEAYDSYFDRAKLVTSVHATPRLPPPEFKTPSTSEPCASTSSKPVSKGSSTIPATITNIKTISSGPLQVSANTISTSISIETSSSAESLPSPAPLGTSDSNVAPSPAAPIAVVKPVKRAAPANSAGARKKALKRL
ncbi:ubiquitin-conjugating enzyme/RWD-like protein [Irpex rosettiformis]|uniref:Ubiquitin-conjugating enzyme/RWD-like protein n=1 Tax=Irpex rosettiformis TaxID=378272 RepID=A0ACB8TQL9_9APHY|nr:ubiquitin-conjugating enzyme/RWD-like protein [Irpex rosettiformis]